MAGLEREEFRVLYLNNQNQLIAGETLFTGTINRTEVHPREVIKRALYHNAAAVVLAHNHPSGEVTPSKADRLITERLVQALGLVDIRVPDHLNATLVEAVQSIEDIKLLRAEQRFQNQWNHTNDVASSISMKQRFLTGLLLTWTQEVQSIVYVVVLLVGCFMVMNGDMTTGHDISGKYINDERHYRRSPAMC